MSVIKGHGTGEVSGDFYSYEINQSLRFNDDTNHYLNKTPSGSGNQKTWTYSFWFKHGSRTAIFDLLLANGSSDKFFEFSITNAQLLQVFYHNETMLVSSMQLRDRSAWYHVVLRHDTTQASADNRLRFYVNGSEVTSWATNGRANLPQDFDGGVNEGSISHLIGQNHVGNNDFDGYLAEVNLIDGTSLGPSSFGETKDGIWIPKEYSTSDGAYGTNGFYLPFDDGSAIGDDESPNTNDWTANNFAATNVVKDSPTNNFNTTNALSKGSYVDHSEGNLKVTGNTSTNNGNYLAFPRLTSGKYYYEQRLNIVSYYPYFVFNVTTDAFYYSNGGTGWPATSNVRISGASAGGYTGLGASTGDIIGIAVDLDSSTKTVKIYKNNSLLETITITTSDAGIGMAEYNGSFSYYNFGQDSSFGGAATAQNNADENSVGDFYYSPPSGYLALCSSNLPDPAIIDGSDNFNTVLYTGNASTNAITGVGFSPDWVWVKNRVRALDHRAYDSVRGVQKTLYPSAGYYENEGGDGTNGLTAFGTDGFTLGSHTGANYSGEGHVSWNWLAGTAFSNDASATSVGTIDSSGQVNTTAGFSIVSYTGTGSAGTIAHNLGVAPSMVMIKARDDTTGDGNWLVYVKAGPVDETDYLLLNSTGAATDEAGAFNDTAATTTTFSVGTFVDLNQSSITYIAYCFANVEGYCKVGSYVGNSLADGTFVYTGFRPAWIMTKSTSSGTQWMVYDNKRLGFNVDNNGLYADDTTAEASDNDVDLVSNGFKWRRSSPNFNNSSHTYIYLAFADQPFKFANAR